MQLIEEKRLIKTLLSKKPQAGSFAMALFTVLLVTVITLFEWRSGLDLSAERSGEYWRLLTAVFVHADVAHLLSNLYMLFIFSFFVYGYFGFLVFPVISLLTAVAVNFVAVMSYPPEMHLLGASGLVYILGGFWLTLYFFIQRQYSVLNRLLRVSGIALMVFFPSTFIPSTSYRAHGIGFLAGIIFGVFYYARKRTSILSHEVFKTTLIEDVVYE